MPPHSARRGALALCGALAATLGAQREAGAELWTSSMGELLRTATRIEVMTVDAVSATHWSARVTESIRGRALGTREALARWHEFEGRVAPGARLLVVCDRSQCPRAVGLEQPGGFFTVRAQEPGDGAWVLPPLVEHASVGPLARGAPARPLCLRGGVDFVDSPATPGTLTATVSAADGTGTAAGTAAPAGARLQAGFGFGGGEPDVVVLSVQGAGRTVEFLGAGVARGAGACLDLRAVPVRPLARTPAELASVWTGAPTTPRVLGSGTLLVHAGQPLAAGTEAASIEVDPGGTIWVNAPRLGGRAQVGLYEISGTRTLMGVSFAPGAPAGALPQLLIEVPRVPGAAAANAPVVAARALQRGSAVWRVLLRRTAGEARPVGELRLHHALPGAAGASGAARP